ncbi:hypothetical protein D3C76_1288860 [compost metagenome]
MRQNIHTAVLRITIAEITCSQGSADSAVNLLLRYIPPKAISQTMAVWEIVAASPSITACRTVPLMAMIKAAIMVLEWPGSRPCKAPNKMALGIKNQALPC